MTKKFIFQETDSYTYWYKDCDTVEEAAELERSEDWYISWNSDCPDFDSAEEQLYSYIKGYSASEIIQLEAQGKFFGYYHDIVVEEAKKIILSEAINKLLGR